MQLRSTAPSLIGVTTLNPSPIYRIAAKINKSSTDERVNYLKQIAGVCFYVKQRRDGLHAQMHRAHIQVFEPTFCDLSIHSFRRLYTVEHNNVALIDAHLCAANRQKLERENRRNTHLKCSIIFCSAFQSSTTPLCTGQTRS